MAHVPLLALVNHFKEAFSEDRRLSRGKASPSRSVPGVLRVPLCSPSSGPSKAAVLSGIALYRVIFAVLLECFFSIYFIQILVIYYLPDNSSPIKIYEFVLKPILDYVSVYEASHESYIIHLNLAIAPHNNNNNKPDHISPVLS